MMINRTNDHHEEGRGLCFDSSRVVRAVIRQVAALGQFMPVRRHASPSVRHDQKSRACHKPRHTSSYSTSCSIRCNTKWRPTHRTPKLLFGLLPVAYSGSARKSLLRFQPSPSYTRRNVFCANASLSQTACPDILQVLFVLVDLLDLKRRRTRVRS